MITQKISRRWHRSALLLAGISLLAAAAALTGCDSQITGPQTAAARLSESHTADEADVSPKGPPLEALMVVGRSHVGSPFPPPEGHDASTHAQDAMQPRTVVISAGGVVTFDIGAFHNAAIYAGGTEPDDIDTGLLEPAGTQFPFPPLINDPSGRLARTPLALPGSEPVFQWTFDAPGRYLVICEVLPHFTDGAMYGWVIVK